MSWCLLRLNWNSRTIFFVQIRFTFLKCNVSCASTLRHHLLILLCLTYLELSRKVLSYLGWFLQHPTNRTLPIGATLKDGSKPRHNGLALELERLAIIRNPASKDRDYRNQEILKLCGQFFISLKFVFVHLELKLYSCCLVILWPSNAPPRGELTGWFFNTFFLL